MEALAQYAPFHADYLDNLQYKNLVPQVVSYLPHPEDSPLYWNNDRDYGSSYLFAYYIAEKYGVQRLRELIKESLDGPRGIEAVIQKAGHNITFNELYLNWITAISIDQIGFENNLYGFEGVDACITSRDIISSFPVINKSLSVNHYAFQILKLISPPNNFTVSIRKSPQDAIGISIAVQDTSGWHILPYLYYEESSMFETSFLGASIKEAYIIITYISNETPIAPDDRGVSQPSIDIEITLN